VVHSVIRAYCVISRTAVWFTGYFALHVIHIKPRILVFKIVLCSSVNRVVVIEAGSIIEAGGV